MKALNLGSKKEDVIQQLAKDVEKRELPKNEVARIVVRELVERQVASPPYIYECLGIEKKRKYEKKDTEEISKVAENSIIEETSTPTIEVLQKNFVMPLG